MTIIPVDHSKNPLRQATLENIKMNQYVSQSRVWLEWVTSLILALISQISYSKYSIDLSFDALAVTCIIKTCRDRRTLSYSTYQVLQLLARLFFEGRGPQDTKLVLRTDLHFVLWSTAAFWIFQSLLSLLKSS